jgi:hypothetical protein
VTLVNDDWRLRVKLEEEGAARALRGRLDAAELEHDLEAAFHDRVIVSVDGQELFCYTGTREQAERARTLIARLAREHGWELETRLERWHPLAERWEDPEKPLPSTAEQAAAEHEELIEEERVEAEAGHPPCELRVQLRSRHDAVALSRTLERERIPHLRRWRRLLVPCPDEDSAAELAERVRMLAPAGAEVEVAQTPPLGGLRPNPFAIFGGLGG